MSDFPFLSVLTVAPLVGAVVVALLPRSRPTLAKQVALGWSRSLAPAELLAQWREARSRVDAAAARADSRSVPTAIPPVLDHGTWRCASRRPRP